MKKLLSILTSMSIIASGSSTVMAMSPTTKINDLASDETSQKLKTIDVPRHADIYLPEVAMFSARIMNFQDLTNIIIWSLDSELVTAKIVDDWVHIWAFKEGNTAVLMKADDAELAIITVTIERMKEIEVDKTAETYLNKTTSLQIKNASELKDLSVKSTNQEIATASIVNDTVQITGVNKGTTEVIVSALNGIEDVQIAVTVSELGTIELDRDQANVIIGDLTEFKITNFEDLRNVSVTSTNPNAVAAAILNDSIIVKGLDLGTTILIVSAENTVDKIISVTVHSRLIFN